MTERGSLERARHEAQARGGASGRPRGQRIGITRAGEGYALKVNCAAPPSREPPAEVDGVPVRVEVVGRIRPL